MSDSLPTTSAGDSAPFEENGVVVSINDQKLKIAQGVTLQSLIDQQGIYSGRGVAVALNGKVARREQWSNLSLNSNDEITIITASQGG